MIHSSQIIICFGGGFSSEKKKMPSLWPPLLLFPPMLCSQSAALIAVFGTYFLPLLQYLAPSCTPFLLLH